MKPHWPDVCCHDRPRDRFLGSFEWLGRMYDVYVYQDNALDADIPDMHVCIRYGEQGELYISPGRADDFVRRVANRADAPDDYRLALPFVLKWLEEWLEQERRSSDEDHR
jgi:hypothetical protein